MMDERIIRNASDAKAAGMPRQQWERFYQRGYLPQPLQMRFHAAARQADTDGATEIGIGGARGPGKSHAIFTQIALDDCQRRSNLKTLYLRKAGKQAKEQLDDLRRKTLSWTTHNYRRHAGVIEFPNGSRIITGHFQNESDIDNYLGLEYDVVAVEEATTLTKTKYQAIRDSTRTGRPDWRARLYNSTNPGGVGHAWYKATFIEPWRSDNEADTRFLFGTIDDNAYISADYRQRLEKNTGWRLRAYRYGDWDISAGQFFTTWQHSAHVCEPFSLPRNWRVWLAMDYGFTHYTVWYLFAQSNDGEVFIVDEHAERGWLPQRHARAVKAMLHRRHIPLHRLHTIVAGADVFAKRGNSTTVAEQYKAEGLPLEAAQMDRINGAANILNYLGDPRQGVPPRVQIMDRCARLIACLPTLEHDPHRPEDVLKVDVDEDGNGGDDPYDAFRYGLMEAPRTQTAGAITYA